MRSRPGGKKLRSGNNEKKEAQLRISLIDRYVIKINLLSPNKEDVNIDKLGFASSDESG